MIKMTEKNIVQRWKILLRPLPAVLLAVAMPVFLYLNPPSYCVWKGPFERYESRVGLIKYYAIWSN